MTRLQLEQTIARRLAKNATTLDTLTQTRLRDFMNEVQREVLSEPGLRHLADDTQTVASVADQHRYALTNVSKVYRFYEPTNDRTLQPMSMAEYRARCPDPTAITGTPTHYVFEGYSPIAKHPSDASQLYAISTSAGDTQTVYLEGEITGGLPNSVSATMTGTTAVALSGATTWERVIKFYLSSAAVGNVSLREDNGTGTVLATIGGAQTQQRYWSFYLYPTPSAVVTYSVDFQIHMTDLAQDTDEPRIPSLFHDLVILGAMAKEYEKTDDTRFDAAYGRYRMRMKDLLYYMASQTLHTGPETAVSRLGPWAPAGPF